MQTLDRSLRLRDAQPAEHLPGIIERVTVVGHSLGGSIAMQFAYQFPDRCERLVLMGGGSADRLCIRC